MRGKWPQWLLVTKCMKGSLLSEKIKVSSVTIKGCGAVGYTTLAASVQ